MPRVSGSDPAWVAFHTNQRQERLKLLLNRALVFCNLQLSWLAPTLYLTHDTEVFTTLYLTSQANRYRQIGYD